MRRSCQHSMTISSMPVQVSRVGPSMYVVVSRVARERGMAPPKEPLFGTLAQGSHPNLSQRRPAIQNNPRELAAHQSAAQSNTLSVAGVQFVCTIAQPPTQ